MLAETSPNPATTRRVAFVYPGQGSHRAGMIGAWDGNPAAAARIASMVGSTGLDLRNAGDDADRCGASTALGQPAILTASLAADAALRAAGIVPHVVAGHSLGEVTAAAAAGVLDAAATGDVVAERGRAMGDACATTPGAMAAVVKFDRTQIEQVLSSFEGVAIANQNADGQVVISGALALFEDAVAALKAAGARIIPLRVEGAFHSPAMAPAVVRLDAVLRRHTLADPDVGIVTGVNGTLLRTATDVRRHLVDGILSPVNWVAVQDRLIDMGIEVLVEVGPGGVLAALARRAHPALAVATVAKPEDIPAVVDLVATATASASV